MQRGLVGSEMCIRDRYQRRVHGDGKNLFLCFGATGMQGWRKDMEDAEMAITNFGSDPNACLFGVFDGHGGREVAEFSSRNFPKELLSNLSFKEGNYSKALSETFLKMDDILRSEDGIKELALISKEPSSSGVPKKSAMLYDEPSAQFMGCTGNVLLIKKNVLYVANAGDSRTIMINSKGEAAPLSTDHKPDLEREKKRISAAGGTIVNGRVEGNLNLCRAIGDLYYKSKKSLPPEAQMITSNPDVLIQELHKDINYIVMGCDGVFERLSNQEIANFILKEDKVETSGKLSPVVERLLDSLISTDVLKTEGLGCDNMTCILIKFLQ
eukprot:TRINITY_DN5858_c0_g1_i2.p1 TRINITY_DN5858_c0_g1~~TRINITY_DN5858_c0_g1_i2.p1  ORF type:complete len:326 (+),score=67.58 TRINITY_DN5858_c0_g1_i2:87-1064(+)